MPTTRQRLSEPWIFGRESQRERLSAAVAKVENGGFAAVHVSGASGARKSVLVERFLEELSRRDPHSRNDRLLILRSHCYEREQVPFKALDAAMDALVTQLSRKDDFEVSHVLPRDIQTLTQLFPALTRLNAVQRLIDPKQPVNTARHARDRADSALQELFARLGTRRTVVLWIDDLHWGDLDSARILKSWMESSALSGVMLILSYRCDEVSTSPCLRYSPRSRARRLREAVLARLHATERATLDRGLLRALEAEADTDVAWLHALALGAGDRPAALRYGIAAAERASQALAFEFAAELYRTCHGLDVHDPGELCTLAEARRGARKVGSRLSICECLPRSSTANGRLGGAATPAEGGVASASQRSIRSR